MVRFHTFEQFHNKKNVGSTFIRVHQLIKHWPEADLYKYGENPEVLIFQKVYVTPDYTFPIHFKGIKILDICDPDWLDNAYIKRTVDAMDAVTCPTEALAEFIRQLTDKPVKVIPDRFEIDRIEPKVHRGKAKSVVWFGYKHNAELLQHTGGVYLLEEMGLKLTVICEGDPHSYRYAKSRDYKDMYSFVNYNERTFYTELQRHDIVILPIGGRPRDRFKSTNKTVKSWMAGMPVATNKEELEKLVDGEFRQKEAIRVHKLAVEDYDVKKSVEEYKQLIEEIKNERK